MKKIIEIDINKDFMNVVTPVVNEKVQLVIIDGYKGKAYLTDAVHHGNTIIETVKGQGRRITWNENELL